MNATRKINHNMATSSWTAKPTNNNGRYSLRQIELRKMMKNNKLLMILLIALLAAGCSTAHQAGQNNNLSVTGSGNLVSRQFDLTGFDRVETGLAFGLTIRHGDRFNVTLTADDNFIDYILVEQVGATLYLGYKPGYAYDVRGVTMHLEVTMPELTGLTLGESSHTRLVEARSAEKFVAVLSGSSALEGDLQAVDARFELSGSTYVNLTGSADQLVLESCGSSIAKLAGFATRDAAIKASCNSISTVMVSGNLDVDASQFAQVFNNGTSVSFNNPVDGSD